MNWLKVLLGFSALLVAGCAAYFSVTGLGVLFSGASIAVMIMASSLEFAKLVCATYLKQKWNVIKGLNKWYLTASVVVLMLITSAGIFGFLSNAFQQQNIKLQQVEREISVWDTKVKSDSQQIASLTVQLNNLQSNQGKILDGGTVNNRLLKSVDNRDVQSQKLQDKINSIQDSTVAYNSKINEIKNDNIELEREIGGFRFVAESFNLPLITVVKFFIILIVLVFDPLAVALIIAFNQMLSDDSKPKEKNDPEPNVEPIINASDLVAEVSKVRLSEEDFKKLEEVLNNPPPPNDNLKEAKESYENEKMMFLKNRKDELKDEPSELIEENIEYIPEEVIEYIPTPEEERMNREGVPLMGDIEPEVVITEEIAVEPPIIEEPIVSIPIMTPNYDVEKKKETI
jgi:hypothetical protein